MRERLCSPRPKAPLPHRARLGSRQGHVNGRAATWGRPYTAQLTHNTESGIRVATDVLYRFPWLVLATALVLTLVGIAGIYAATAGDDPPPFWESMAARQLGWLGAALAVFALALVPSYTRLAYASYYVYGASLVVLAVLAFMHRYDLVIPGFIYPIHGAYSWIHVPGRAGRG